MKKHFSLSVFLALLGFLLIAVPANAQRRKSFRQSHFLISTSPLDWSKGQANLCASGIIWRRIGLCSGGGFQAGTAIRDNYQIQSAQLVWDVEIRIYPFGGPCQLKSMFDKHKATACFSFKKEVAVNSPLSGLYVAPGYSRLIQYLSYTPLFVSPTPEFKYTIKQRSATLAIGYDLHIWRFTIGARWQTQAGHAIWEGPVDIFGSSLNKVNYPFKLNVTNRFNLSAGINF